MHTLCILRGINSSEIITRFSVSAAQILGEGDGAKETEQKAAVVGCHGEVLLVEDRSSSCTAFLQGMYC